MITLVHGTDTESSYTRLTQLLLKFPNHTKIRLDQDTSDEKIYQALFTQSLTGDKELIIFEDALKKTGTIAKILEKQTPTKEIIFWERQDVEKRVLGKLPKNIRIEYFKKSLPIYAFLDSIVPKSKKAQALVREQQDHILWHLQHRILLLILAKIGFDIKKASITLTRPIQDWQWQKIKDQSAKFELPRLLAFFQGALKVDYMIKTGKTSLDENTLTSILLLKYLQ